MLVLKPLLFSFIRWRLASTENSAVSGQDEEMPTDTDKENDNFQMVGLNLLKSDQLEQLPKVVTGKLAEVLKVKKVKPVQSVKMVIEV